MKIFGLAGWSGSGKTTLMVRLLPEIVGRGHTVSTIKHAHHSFEIDTPGKDSFEHRNAGRSVPFLLKLQEDAARTLVFVSSWPILSAGSFPFSEASGTRMRFRFQRRF